MALLLQKQFNKCVLVVVSNASSKKSCVELIVLLLVSNSKSATKTILFEFIFVFYLLLTKYAVFLFYAGYFLKIHTLTFVIMYVQSLSIRRFVMKEVLLDRRLQTLVRDYVPQGEILDDLVCFFSIFSDYTRLKMISALAISEMCVSDISTLLKLNQTTVSHQLRLLKNLNAVTTRRQGKVVFYSLRNELLNDVLLKGVEFLGY